MYDTLCALNEARIENPESRLEDEIELCRQLIAFAV